MSICWPVARMGFVTLAIRSVESGPGSDRMTGNAAWQELVQVALGPDGPLVAESLRINILTEVQL